MSRTLFLYVFKDLLRIFFLTVLALAGIMSFGGLLQPLTRQGLEVGQLGRILTYLAPAMTTYALPIAALFATTMVYGRLSADNELTACRASGISHLAVAAPAFLLGLAVSIFSLLLLCFIVPKLTLEVERIINSNIGRIIATKIDHDHQIQFGNFNVFAQGAHLYPADLSHPRQQIVSLEGPMFVDYESSNKALYDMIARDPTGELPRALAEKQDLDRQWAAMQKQPGVSRSEINALHSRLDQANWRVGLRIPREFWMARVATVYITANPHYQRYSLSAHLEGGYKFPRVKDTGATSTDAGGIEAVDYGPIAIPSLVGEKTKYMDLSQLKLLFSDSRQSVRVREIVEDFVRAQQQAEATQRLFAELNRAGSCTFNTGSDIYTLTRAADSPAELTGNDLILPASKKRGSRLVTLRAIRNGSVIFTADADHARVRVTSDLEQQRLVLDVYLYDAFVGNLQGASALTSPHRTFSVPMPADISAIERQKPESFLSNKLVTPANQNSLNHELVRLSNYIQSELHARCSFAFSCWILVMVGAALGMMFKSGNFLSAFAVSAVPALVCIALIVTGQHTMENIPDIVTPSNNPLHLGMAIIWSGNVAVLAIGTVLLGRLQRQ